MDRYVDFSFVRERLKDPVNATSCILQQATCVFSADKKGSRSDFLALVRPSAAAEFFLMTLVTDQIVESNLASPLDFL
jgi:hypothetical protein